MYLTRLLPTGGLIVVARKSKIRLRRSHVDQFGGVLSARPVQFFRDASPH